MERYYGDKLSMSTQPGADLTVANGDSELLRQHETLLGPRVEWVSQDDDPGTDWMTPLAPSFGRFRDYRDRSEAFAQAVCALS